MIKQLSALALHEHLKRAGYNSAASQEWKYEGAYRYITLKVIAVEKACPHFFDNNTCKFCKAFRDQSGT